MWTSKCLQDLESGMLGEIGGPRLTYAKPSYTEPTGPHREFVYSDCISHWSSYPVAFSSPHMGRTGSRRVMEGVPPPRLLQCFLFPELADHHLAPGQPGATAFGAKSPSPDSSGQSDQNLIYSKRNARRLLKQLLNGPIHKKPLFSLATLWV